jgi:cell division protease FtsH
MNRKRLLIGIVIVYTLMSVLGKIGDLRSEQELKYSEFIKQVRSDKVTEVLVVGQSIIQGETNSGERFRVNLPWWPDSYLQEILDNYDVEVKARKSYQDNLFLQILLSLLPLFLIFIIFMMLPKQLNSGMMNGRNGPLSFGRNRANLHQPEEVTTTFADVAGVDEAREDVQELVEFLKNPEKFQKVGGRIPHGVLMVGPPGTGKTLLARAIAGEAGVPFFSISGSDFVEMFVGVGASRVRDMFAQARKIAPCIVFIDEIDAVGRQRGAGLGGGHDEREQTLNQLLVEMDGFDKQDGIIVIAATNRPDVLDGALLRPGRFDRQLMVNLPDLRGRLEILKVHTKKLPISAGTDLNVIARGTTGFSGADLANLVNEAALLTARNDRLKITIDDMDRARDKIMMGTERRSLVLPDKEKLLTAYHESGHAIIGRLQENHDPVYKVTIIPRGQALGLTMFLPEEDKYSHTRDSIIAQVRSLFGGRIAEELVYGKDHVTTGASSDIRRATEMVRNMVTKWGLSDEMGPVMYDDSDEQVFVGRSMGAQQGTKISGQTAQKIDAEVRRILDQCYKEATKMLKDNRDTLERMTKALLKFETLDEKQLDDIMAGKDPRAPVEVKDATKAKSTKKQSKASGGAKKPVRKPAAKQPGVDSGTAAAGHPRTIKRKP